MGLVQCGQRLAASGMFMAHCGQGFSVGAAAGAGCSRLSVFMPRTTKKSTKATIVKLMTVLRKRP